MGRDHEDLVSVSGVLGNGVVVSMQVNWLTPTKQRNVTVLGERGAFVADMLSADLTFYSNADIPTEWDAVARLRGVSEGDMVRYAIRKPEPLRSELEAFRDAVLGGERGQIVSLTDGVEVLRVAERILESAAPSMGVTS
jgi:predicted dehydrogenase